MPALDPASGPIRSGKKKKSHSENVQSIANARFLGLLNQNNIFFPTKASSAAGRLAERLATDAIDGSYDNYRVYMQKAKPSQSLGRSHTVYLLFCTDTSFRQPQS